MLCNLALISADSQIERRSSEAGRSVRGCGEWLAGHLTVGYQRDNNVWRQAGAMYVLQKNNCYPFKSHFLIGLAVVEGNLERRQVRDRLREWEGERGRKKGRGGDGESIRFECYQPTKWDLSAVIITPIIMLQKGQTAPTSRSVGAYLLFSSLINRKVTSIHFCHWIQGQLRMSAEAVFFFLTLCCTSL